MRKSLLAAGALVFGLAAVPAVHGQADQYDKVLVNLPYTVTVGGHVLQPGPYVIRQVDSSGAAGATRTLLIYSNDGRQFETSALTIPVADPLASDETKVVLHHFGPDYYFDKVWIQGKVYGYEFPLPDEVKARMREQEAPLTIAATYEAVTEAPPVAEAPPPPPPAPVEEAPPPPEVAEAPPPPPPAPPVEAPREMPVTSSGWLTLLLAGGAMSGLGLALRRRA